MNSSLLILLITLAVFSTVSSAPSHKKDSKHASCTEKLYHGLQRMCDGKADPDFLRDSASRCCRKNCEVTEMLTFCLVGSAYDDLRF